jgi:hypothetical protein
MRQLTKWAYVGDDDRLHVDIPTLVKEIGFEDTPKIRENVTAGAVQAIREKYPNMPTILHNEGTVTVAP